MVNIIGITTLDLSREHKRCLVLRLSEAVATVFEEHSLYLDVNPPEYASQCAKNQIHFVSFVPENITEDQKRGLIAALHDTLMDIVGFKGNLKDIVIFKYIPAAAREHCGVRRDGLYVREEG
jgi:phenylpyruvate tautomerase PptA (4-oxalocrotonate tautomerase family)